MWIFFCNYDKILNRRKLYGSQRLSESEILQIAASLHGIALYDAYYIQYVPISIRQDCFPFPTYCPFKCLANMQHMGWKRSGISSKLKRCHSFCYGFSSQQIKLCRYICVKSSNITRSTFEGCQFLYHLVCKKKSTCCPWRSSNCNLICWRISVATYELLAIV